MDKPTNQPWQVELKKTKLYKYGGSCWECCDYEEICKDNEQFITELLQREKEESCKVGYNYARKEMKQWAEEKVGDDKLLQELLEELK